MKRWPRRRPKEDQRLVGISFVDVLFALVIGKVLEPFANLHRLPTSGVAQLVLAGILTLASWIGYHNSWNRPRYFIRFPNLPLLQFVIDVALVVLYWLTAVYAEGAVLPACTTRVLPTCREISAVPEATFVTICFLLYMAWDGVALLIRKDPQYQLRAREKDVPARRRVTGLCFLASFAVWAYTFLASPLSSGQVVFWDMVLLVIILIFRFLKEYVTSESAYGDEEA